MKTITDLLLERFNIPLEDYWTLDEDQKNQITELIHSQYEVKLRTNPDLWVMYMAVLHNNLSIAERNEEFVKCEMLKRSIRRLRKRINTDDFNFEE